MRDKREAKVLISAYPNESEKKSENAKDTLYNFYHSINQGNINFLLDAVRTGVK